MAWSKSSARAPRRLSRPRPVRARHRRRHGPARRSQRRRSPRCSVDVIVQQPQRAAIHIGFRQLATGQLAGVDGVREIAIHPNGRHRRTAATVKISIKNAAVLASVFFSQAGAAMAAMVGEGLRRDKRVVPLEGLAAGRFAFAAEPRFCDGGGHPASAAVMNSTPRPHDRRSGRSSICRSK